jgi:hypothetical protein
MRKTIKTIGIKFFILGLILLFHSKGYGQIGLSYDDFGVYFKPQRKVDTLEFKLTQNYPGFTLRLFLKDFGGSLFLNYIIKSIS